MNRFIYILARLKWLGLIGLLGSITDKAYLKLFWLFFLLGFIDIFSNLSIFFKAYNSFFHIPLYYLAMVFAYLQRKIILIPRDIYYLLKDSGM